MNPNLNAADYAAGVRQAMAEERAALGQSAATTPVLFVNIPYDFGPGGVEAVGDGNGNQIIKAVQQGLTDDPSFNAAIGAQIDDVDMDGTDPYFGGQHLDTTDMTQLVSRLAVSIANEFAQYAQPGSPVALAGGVLDAAGPQAISVQAMAGHPDQLLVQLALAPGSSSIQPLSAAAADGAGWQVRDGRNVVYGTAAQLVDGGQDLLVTFTGAVSVDGQASLFYGYGPGRIFPETTDPSTGAAEAAGQDAAVYDNQGMPLWETAVGLVVAAAPTAAAMTQTISTSSEATVLTAQPGCNELVMASGPLFFDGGASASTVFGGAGNLVVTGGLGRVTAFGASGSATLIGGAQGNDVLVAGSGNTVIVGTEDDTLVAGSGNAALYAGGGDNFLYGGSATSQVTLAGGAGSNVYIAGIGQTTIFTGSGADTIWASPGPSANAVIIGGSGQDLLIGGSGTDAFFGGPLGSTSTIIGGSGAATIVGGGGNATIFVAAGPDCIEAGQGNNVVVMAADAAANTVVFGAGNTTVWNQGGPNTFVLMAGQGGGQDMIVGFRPGEDHLTLVGYGGSTATQAVASQTGSGLGVTFQLNDGTSVTLAGIASLQTSFFS